MKRLKTQRRQVSDMFSSQNNFKPYGSAWKDNSESEEDYIGTNF